MVLVWAPLAQANCTLRSGNLAATDDSALTDNSNGTITHAATGLMWKKCPEGRTYSSGSCTGTTGTYAWQAALRRAVTDATATNSDWRLPSRSELLSIVETGCSTPAINTTRFPNMPSSGQFWSSTHAGTGAPDSAWAVNFNTGSSIITPKSVPGHVRLVRNVTDGAHDEYNRTGNEPTAFAFTPQTGVAINATVASNSVTITWPSATASYSATIVGGQYRVGAGAYVSSGTIPKGSLVNVQLTSSPMPNITSSAVLTINGVSSQFKVTTMGIEPDPFEFPPATGKPHSVPVTSETVTLTGITAARSISVAGGTYSKNGGAFGSGASTVVNGDTVAVQLTPAANFIGTSQATLTVNGFPFPFNVTTTEPEWFTIPPKINVTRGARIILDAVQVRGLTAGRSATITGTGTPWHSVGAGATTPANNLSKTVTNNQFLTVSLLAPTTTNASNSGTVSINGYDAPFSVTTGIEPTPFSFTDQTNVAPSTVMTSNTVALTGLTLQGGTNNPYSISGGTTPQYSLNGSASWLATAGSNLSNGNTFAVRHTSAACPNTTTTTNLVINGYNFPFSSTTVAGPQPTPFTFASQGDVCANATITSAASPALACLPNGSADISVAGGTYRIGTGGYTAAAGTVNNGSTVNVQLTSAATANTPTTATLTINGNPFTFTATTPTYAGAQYFPDVTGVCPSTVVVSASSPALTAGTATVSCGTAAGVADSGAPTTYATSQAVTNGQTVTVRQTSSPSLATTTTIHMAFLGSVYPFSVTTRAVDAPSSLAFATKFAAAGTLDVISDTATISGLCAARPILISGDGNPEFNKVNVSSTTWYDAIDTNITIANANTLRLRLDAGDPGTTRTATLTIGGNPYTYSVTAYSGPDSFVLTPATVINASQVEESLPVTISGLSHPPMTATFTSSTSSAGISKSTNGGSSWSTFTTGTNTNVSVSNGDMIKVRITAGSSGVTRTGTVTINGQAFIYSFTTP